MEYINYFTKNLYVLFAMIIYTIFMNSNPKDKNKKIIVIYIFIVILAIFKILSIKIMLGIFLITFFLYFEILIDDYYKPIILKNPLYKLIDFLYLLILKYYFLFFVVLLLLISQKFNWVYEILNLNNSWCHTIVFFVFIVLFLLLIIIISGRSFELKSFSEMVENMKKVDFDNFQILTDDKKRILFYLEDRTFESRKNSYTILCSTYIKKYRKKIIKLLKNPFKCFKYFKRGYSTIEMQLFRSISVRDGYEKKFIRKITELIYTPMFFKSFKNYLKLNYAKVSDNYYKDYIIACYLNWAIVFYNGHKFKNIKSLFAGIKGVPSKSDFLFYVLCLSNKSSRISLNKEEFLNEFGYLVNKFDIKDTQLDKTIEKFTKINKMLK